MSSHRRAQPMADINVTPLIDVLLVLLIVFMVAVPSTTRVLEATVPQEGTPPPPGPTPAPIPTLQVHVQDFELGRDRHSTLASLERALVDLFESRRDRRIIVRSDDDVDYGRVIAAMDAARGAGVDRIGIASALPAFTSSSPQ